MKYGFDSELSREFPSMVQLTITNVCDMSCSHCPHPDYIKRHGFELIARKAVLDTIDAGLVPQMSLMLFLPTSTDSDLVTTIENSVDLI